MLFGDPHTFAVEAELQEIYGTWIYAKLRFVVDGRPIGDFENLSCLAISARWARDFLGASARRTRADLDDVAPRDVYELLYGRFIQPIRAPISRPYAGPWDRKPYLLDDVGDYGLRDRYAALVVRRADGVDRLLVLGFEEDRLTETLVPPGQCDRTLEAYCTWVEQLRETAPLT